MCFGGGAKNGRAGERGGGRRAGAGGSWPSSGRPRRAGGEGGRTGVSIGCAYVLPRTTRRSNMMLLDWPLASAGARNLLRFATACGSVAWLYEGAAARPA